ncbi:hypothetical protein ACHELQ_001969 [Vibrio fluvialis]
MTRIDFFNAVKNKRLEQLSLEELAYAHLSDSNFTQTNHGLLISSLSTVLREIRHVKWQTYGNSFLPLSAAFTVLDQLGYCYENAELTKYGNQKASSIKKSLYYFCGFAENDTDTQTLVALRNSFLHTASGLSKAQYPNQPNHMFVFDSEANDLITYPTHGWDGSFSTLNNAHATFVNQKKLIAMVEAAVEKARELLYEDKLVVSLPEGCPEFYYRFLKHYEQ